MVQESATYFYSSTEHYAAALWLDEAKWHAPTQLPSGAMMGQIVPEILELIRYAQVRATSKDIHPEAIKKAFLVALLSLVGAGSAIEAVMGECTDPTCPVHGTGATDASNPVQPWGLDNAFGMEDYTL